MKHQPLLSVIVPCYNVEKYIDKCISSIVNQTYPNLEILLINDGSTDSTGILCDEWQKRDSRIRVIHKQNEGLSYARKTGVENAAAEFVTFVDSDDWIDPDMYSDMMSAMISTDSDIAQCDFYEVYEDDTSPFPLQRRGEEPEVVEREEGVLLILDDKKWRSYMWNKIFKKRLFDHIVFPKGRVYEDIPIMFSLFHHASRSVYLSAKYYCYYRRNDSITKIKDIQFLMKSHADLGRAYHERYLFVEHHPEYHSILPFVKSMTYYKGIRLLRCMAVYPQYFPGECFNAKANQLLSIPFPQGKGLTFKLKIERIVMKTSLTLYKMFIKLNARIIPRTAYVDPDN